jgi:hypothetical protein
MLAMHLALIQIKQKNKQLKSKKIYKKKFKKDIIEILDILIPFRF